MLAYNDYNKWRKIRGKYKNTTKEERAKELNNVICPRCKYQNHLCYVKKYGKCHLCGLTLDKNYFERQLLRRLNNG